MLPNVRQSLRISDEHWGIFFSPPDLLEKRSMYKLNTVKDFFIYYHKQQRTATISHI